MADNGYRLSGTTTAHYEFEAIEETTLHKELLIIEKDGAEFKLCPTFEQRYNVYRKLRLWGIIACLSFVWAILFQLEIMKLKKKTKR